MEIERYRLYTYDPDQFPFPGIYRRLLEVEDLEKLSSGLGATPQQEKRSIYKNMEQTPLYQRLFQNLEIAPEFQTTFRLFLARVIAPILGESFYYQQKPSHRIHFTDSRGQLRFHKDMDYGHYEEEINICVPATPAFETNSIYIESAPGKKDFIAMNMQPGQLAMFKGATHTHGARLNTTGNSRVSFDFRVIPVSSAPEALSHQPEEGKASPLSLKTALVTNPHRFAFMDITGLPS